MDYPINATGDCVVGDAVCFERVIFSGSFRKPKFSHMETIQGVIIKDSYGADKQQHTFTLLLPDENKLLIKGRNLYRNGVMRKAWPNEQDRKQALKEKHDRGDIARSDRAIRKGELNPF